MDAPAHPCETRPIRRGWLRFVVRGVLVGLVLAGGTEVGRVFVGRNFHTVEPGKVYRCSQPSPEQLSQLIQQYGIRTVINLRGSCSSFDWYLDECRTSARFDVCQEDVCFSAGRLPSVPEIRHLIEVLDRTEYPVVFHCQRGADRTGLASVVALLLYTDVPYDVARRQLGLRYGHLALGRPANLDRFFTLYEEWLAHEGLSHSREQFRRWVMHDYCPGECRAVIEPLEIPAPVPAGEPFGAKIRVHNTSIKPWHFQPSLSAGIHVTFVVQDAHGVPRATGRAGLFDGVVQPGQSIDLTLPVSPLWAAGRYVLVVDVMDEQHCNFFQTGSEPLEWEFEVRE